MNNYFKLPNSLVSFKPTAEMSGIDIPWVYVGQKYSTFCWHYEDLMLYSINYSHWGKPKLWYGVPCEDREKFDKAVQEKLALLFKEDPNILMDIVTMVNPTYLINKGVRIFRTLQMPGEFVLTFPGSYHAGFSLGLNIGEACNFMSKSWLKHGFQAAQIYRKTREKIGVFPMDWIVTQNVINMARVNIDRETKVQLVEHFKEILRLEKSERQEMEEAYVAHSSKGSFEAKQLDKNTPEDEH